MAKIKFGMMMTDARGKLGGQVFSKNRAGAYVRTKVTPANPRTIPQMVSRSILGMLSAGWNGLTDAQRASFNNAVNAWQKTNIFGDMVKPTGKNLYTSLNKNLLQAKLTPVNVAPQKMDLPALTGFIPTFDIATGEIDLGIASVPADVVLQVSATPTLNAGVNYISGKSRVLVYIPTGAVDTGLIYDEYVYRFGAPTSGANIHFQLKYIGTNGQAGVPVSAKAEYI